MNTPTIVVAMAALPLMSFGATYAVTRPAGHQAAEGRRPSICTGGHQRAMDGVSCTDWVLIDSATGRPAVARVD